MDNLPNLVLDISKSRLLEIELEKTLKKLKPRLEELQSIAKNKDYQDDASSLYLPRDSEFRTQISRAINSIAQERLRYLIIVGIGGSNLGTMAIYDALRGMPRWLDPEDPNILFLDTVESDLMERFKDIIRSEIVEIEEVAVCIISKSGTTTEAIANASILLYEMQKRWPNRKLPITVISNRGSELIKLAQKQEWSILEVPVKVGGRYSVLSSVGLFPLGLAGFNINSFQKGAYNILEKCLTIDRNNPAVQSAAVLWHHLNHGKSINDLFVFRPQLESLGKWYRQLTAESLGKEKDLKGKDVNAGITPTVSVGSTDLHSIGQLHLGGPLDKVVSFMYATSKESVEIAQLPITKLAKGIHNKTLADIQKAILQGAVQAYEKKGIPIMQISLPEISEYSIGQFMQWKMIETMLMGELMSVNPFDQPNVEEYKKKTQSILGE
ncbi:MAG: hypothetical protein V1853_00950 [bacterium]